MYLKNEFSQTVYLTDQTLYKAGAIKISWTSKIIEVHHIRVKSGLMSD